MAQSTWALAGHALRRHKGRAFAMGLAIVVGVASITLTVATGEGARREVERSFKAMIGALDVLFVEPGGTAQRGMATSANSIQTLSMQDASAIAGSVPNVSMVGAQQSDLAAPIEVAGKSGITSMFGVTANWGTIRGDSVAKGAYFSEADRAALARVAVIGSDVARDYFPGGNPIGQHVRIRDIDFTVVGVLAPNGAGPGGISIDNVVYVPLETSQRRVLNNDYLSMASVKLSDPSRWSQTQTAVRALVRERHGKSGDELDDFRVISPQAIIARVANVSTTLRTALLWVGVLALLIGGVVIASLMFASSISRKREIATRRAVGASRHDIIAQFWAEAVLVSAGAAALGAGAAIAATELGARAMRMQLAISWPVTLVAILASIAVGALAGYLPARQAASIPPGLALRDEE